VVLLYVLSVHAAAANSDGATVVLEGQALRSGNLTLSNWRLSFDSFWTVDAPFYAVGVAILGVRPALSHLVPALIAALVVLVGAGLARGGRRGAAGWAGALTVVALLAFPAHALAEFLLLGPLHVGTVLWCLLAFGVLSLAEGRWRFPVAACLLAAGILGDLQTLALGVIPVFFAGVAAMARHRSWRRGMGALVTAVGSVGTAGVVRFEASALGTYSVASSQRATGQQVTRNLSLEPGYIARLLGVGGGAFGTGGAPAILGAVHLVGLVAVVAAVVSALGRLLWGAVAGRPVGDGRVGLADVGPVGAGRAGAGRVGAGRAGEGRAGEGQIGGRRFGGEGSVALDDLLVVGVIADLVMFASLTLSSSDVSFARYLVPGVIFAAILAGRGVASLADRRPSSLPLRGSSTAGAAVLACLAFGAGAQIAAPVPVQPQGSLGDFLADNGLYQGLGDYWTSSVITVDTRSQVTVRPVMADPGGQLEGYGRQSATAWYTGQKFQFLIYYNVEPVDGVDAISAEATFGQPAKTFTVGGYEILVWPQPVTVPAG
jgi:hypothetical protein